MKISTLLLNHFLRQKKNQETMRGFTLIELMAVILIIGILSAIAVPGWNGFVNRQRTRTVNDAVFQALRKAQNQAKSKKEDILVTFTPTGVPPIVIPAVQIGDLPEEQLNANGEIKVGMVQLVTSDTVNNSITFDSLGSVENTPFTVTVSTADGGFRRCVIVQTILGSMRTAEGDNCL